MGDKKPAGAGQEQPVDGKRHPALSDADLRTIREAGERGDMDEARRIVESKGLTWLSSAVRKEPHESPDASRFRMSIQKLP